MASNRKLCHCAALAILLVTTVETANILCLMGVASRSHQLWSNVLFTALTTKGHHLTIVSADVEEQLSPNITFIHLERTYETLMKHYEAYSTKAYEPISPFVSVPMWYDYQMASCKGHLASQGFRTALELGIEDKSKFDLIIADTTNGPWCLLNLAHAFDNVPIVGISAFKVTPDVFEMARGGIASPASVPYFATEFDEDMRIWQRWYNTFLYALAHIYKYYVAYPVLQNMVTQNEYLRKANIPLDAELLKQRIKVVLVNSHPAIDYAQPIPPNVIEIGGLQIQEPKPLPAAMVEFINSGKKGAIFMSFGTNIRAEFLGPERINAIVNVVRRFPEYAFLWKVEAQNLITNIPENLHISSWFPQQDILAHENVKAFFTHAGSMSIQEAVYHGVPVILLPFMLDQFNNAQRASERGFGVHLDFNNFGEGIFYQALLQVLTNSNYATKAKQFQHAFRNQPVKPLDTAVWWVEQLLAQPEAFDHLVSKSADKLSYFTLHSLDVIGLVLLFLVLFSINSFIVIKQLVTSFKKPKTVKSKISKTAKLKKN